MTNIIKHQFQGQAVSFNTDGWINATEVAKRFNKRLDHWLENAETLDYVKALAEVTSGKKSNIVDTRKSGYVKTSKARMDRGGGTWLHPKLAVAFARWCDAKFSVWCDLQIDELIRSSLAPAGMTEYMLQMLRHEPAGWERRFPPDYYHALARVTNTAYCGHQGGTPAIYGGITMQWVYQAVMPAEVLSEIKGRRQGGEKLHQWLSEGGAAVLDRQIGAVTMLANTSCDYQDFTARCSQVFGVKGQIRMVLPSAA